MRWCIGGVYMKLILNITSFHKFTPEIEGVFVFESVDEYAKISFGRSSECDWILPDPERVISGMHGEVIKFGEQYLIKDLSTNGIFINNSVTAIGLNNEVSLSNGDIVNLGDYQIEVVVNPSIGMEHHSSKASFVKGAIESPARTDFGLNASELMNKTIPSDFELDLGLVDDYIEVQSEKGHKTTQSPELGLHTKNQAKLRSYDSENEVNAFVRGMSIDPKLVPRENREQWFEQLGHSFSLLLVGLMDTLHHRAAFKQSNRLSHTSFRKSENNPLKFSANLEDAIYNLYNRNTSSFLSADTAIIEAFSDIDNHEKALMEGVKGTVSSVMSLVEPTTIYKESNSKSSALNKLIPARKYAQSWSVFENIHSGLKDEIANNNSPFYLDDFAKHYELALKKKY